MVLYRHGLYAIGARLKDATDDVASGELGIFAVERFVEAEHIRGREFEVPPNVQLRSMLHGSFGPHLVAQDQAHDVVIEFSREKALLVSSRSWHQTQRIEALSNGRLRLSFTCGDLTPIVSWVLEWGPHARAISPPGLVQTVKEELDAARAQY